MSVQWNLEEESIELAKILRKDFGVKLVRNAGNVGDNVTKDTRNRANIVKMMVLGKMLCRRWLKICRMGFKIRTVFAKNGEI